jgi:signal transduction histidine kinase
MMEGIEKEWNYVSSERRFSSYTRLSPGNYIFRVKGSNNDGVWNEKGASLIIKIQPPFWRTWWFILLVIILFVSVILIIFKMTINYVKQVSEKERLENELKFKANFIAMMVHDLRSPLQGILGYSDLIILKSDREDDVKKAGRIVSKSANSMITLINDMLDVYKFEAHKMIIKKEELVLGTLLYDVTLLIKPLLFKKNISYEQHIEVNDKINADPNRISRVINNLLSNAIKFSPENGIITVSITRVQKHTTWYQELAVLDQGPGIEESKQKHLFNAYAQLQDKTGKLSKGTGLGLAVSKMIIEAHAGIIGYRSGKNGGSEFYFCLPMA